MQAIIVEKETVEQIKDLSEEYNRDFPHPIFLECSNNKSTLVYIKQGKFVEYVTGVEIFIPDNYEVGEYKLILNHKDSDLNLEKLSNVKLSSDSALDAIMGELRK